MDSEVYLERLIRRHVTQKGEFRPQKPLVDQLAQLVQSSCYAELDALGHRQSLRSRSLSSSGIPATASYNDDLQLAERRARAVADAISFEVSFKRCKWVDHVKKSTRVRAKVLRVCQRVASSRNRRSSSDSRAIYSSTADSNDTMMAISGLSFGQSMKSVDGDEAVLLVERVSVSDMDMESRRRILEQLSSISVAGLVRSRTSSRLVASMPDLVKDPKCFDHVLYLLVRLLSTQDDQTWMSFCGQLGAINDAVMRSTHLGNVRQLQFADFVYQLFSRPHAFYKTHSPFLRHLIVTALGDLFEPSECHRFASPLVSMICALDSSAQLVQARLTSKSSCCILVPRLMRFVGSVASKELTEVETCFVFCVINHILHFSDASLTADWDLFLPFIGTAMNKLLIGGGVAKHIRRTATKSLLRAVCSDFGALFYLDNLLSCIASLRSRLACQVTLTMLSCIRYSPTEFDDNAVILQLVRKCLLRRTSTIFNAVLELLSFWPQWAIRELFEPVDTDIVMNRLNPANEVHSKFVFKCGLTSKSDFWRQHFRLLILSNNLHLIKHPIDYAKIAASADEKRTALKMLTSFLSREPADARPCAVSSDWVWLTVLQPGTAALLLKATDLTFFMDDRFKRLYATLNTHFLSALSLVLSTPDLVVQFVTITHANGIECDENSELCVRLLRSVLLATPVEFNDIDLSTIKSCNLQDLFCQPDLSRPIFQKFDFSQLTDPLWDTFLDSKRTAELDLNDLLLYYLDRQKEVAGFPDWFDPCLDYSIGLGLIKSRRKTLKQIQNQSVFSSDRTDWFGASLLMATDFDLHLTNQVLATLDKGCLFRAASFPTIFHFNQAVSSRVFPLVEKMCNDSAFCSQLYLVEKSRTPVLHSILSWINRSYLGLLPFKQIRTFLGYQIVLGEDFTAVFVAVILKHLACKLSSISSLTLEDDQLCRYHLDNLLSEFMFSDHLNDFIHVRRLQVHYQDH